MVVKLQKRVHFYQKIRLTDGGQGRRIKPAKRTAGKVQGCGAFT